MDTYYIAIAGVAFACGLVILMFRNTSFLKKFSLSSIGGLLAFGAVNLTGLFTGVSLVANVWTICTAVFLGLPGVVALMFMKIILNV